MKIHKLHKHIYLLNKKYKKCRLFILLQWNYYVSKKEPNIQNVMFINYFKCVREWKVVYLQRHDDLQLNHAESICSCEIIEIKQ